MTDLSAATLHKIRCAAEIIHEFHQGVVLTGAGISTPSGIPDFRSPNSGLWERYDPFEVASLTSFRYQPEKFYEWIRPLAQEIFAAQPNPAHYAVVDLERHGYVQTVITQNIDNLHQRAGSRLVLEVHGSLETFTCVSCYEKVAGKQLHERYLVSGEVPRCAGCGSVLKPDIVLFGEQLPVRTWLAAQEASRRCDLMIVAGSSLEVLPVAGLPMRALENGAHLILINKSETYLDVRADIVFREDVSQILPRIVEEVVVD
ncbi:MAG: NAD-dependent deacylase [Chloroflexi bacterium]|jgi:NAD-dependent deacetylase|nr:NAD-dependent deacylase [Chloroflexota bacterium]